MLICLLREHALKHICLQWAPVFMGRHVPVSCYAADEDAAIDEATSRSGVNGTK